MTSQQVRASLVNVLTVGWHVTVTVTVLVDTRHHRHTLLDNLLSTLLSVAALRAPKIHLSRRVRSVNTCSHHHLLLHSHKLYRESKKANTLLVN